MRLVELCFLLEPSDRELAQQILVKSHLGTAKHYSSGGNFGAQSVVVLTYARQISHEAELTFQTPSYRHSKAPIWRQFWRTISRCPDIRAANQSRR
jgi:hypothetical protein